MSTDLMATDTPVPAAIPVKPKKPKKAKAKAKPKAVAKPKKKTAPKKAAKAKTPAKKAKSSKKQPRKPASIKHKLYKLLLKKLPKSYRHADGSLDAQTAAKKAKVTSEAFYQWLRKDKVMPDKALTLMKMSGGKLKLSDMLEFVFKN